MNEARNWTEFTDALRGYVVPSQNFVYADVDGHIGYYAPGRIPMRASGDGSRPADGWTGDAEWTGWVPFEELPHLFDPPEHVIVTANHRPAPPSYRYNLGLEWTEPYRAQRIVDRLGEKRQFTPDDFARIQADTVSLHAKSLLPMLLAHRARLTSDDRRDDRCAAAMEFRRDRATAPRPRSSRRGFSSSRRCSSATSSALPSRRRIRASSRSCPAFSPTLWRRTTRPGATTRPRAAHETCDEAVATAFHRGVEDLRRRMGSDMTRWRWDTVHVAMFPHALDSVAALRPILSRSVGIGGDWSTVNVGVSAADHPYEVHTVPGYREIIDLSPANDSRFLDAVGESGHPLSPHYDDFLDRLARGDAQEDADGRAPTSTAARSGGSPWRHAENGIMSIQRREFLKDVAAAAGLVFVGCGLGERRCGASRTRRRRAPPRSR